MQALVKGFIKKKVWRTQFRADVGVCWISLTYVVFSFFLLSFFLYIILFCSYILLTDVQMFILREIPKRDGWAFIQNRHHLTSVVKITSKRRHPDLITFKYGTSDGETIEVTETERYVIPNAKKATQKIKDRILKLVDESWYSAQPLHEG